VPALNPSAFAYVAENGIARLEVHPEEDAELFERVVPFGAAASGSLFHKVPGVFAEDETRLHSADVPIGSLYQARLFRRDAISPGTQPTDDDVPLGRVDLPAIITEARTNLLTTCDPERAQIVLDAGGNYLKAALATGGARTRMLLLVGDIEPTLVQLQVPFPRFSDRNPVAASASRNSGLLHRVIAPPPNSHQSTDRVSPQQSIFFIALVWTENGSWDFVWSETRKAGEDGEPQELTTKTRTIEIEVRQMTCVDDDHFDDDPHFLFALESEAEVLASKGFTWEDMSSGSITKPHLSLSSSGGAESDMSFVSINVVGFLEPPQESVPLPIADGAPHRRTKHRLVGPVSGPNALYVDVDITVSYD
jgi:hypothetical protein